MLIVSIILTVLLLIGIIQSNQNKNKGVQTNDAELLEAGLLLFPDFKEEFESFFSSFLNDKEAFLARNEELLNAFDNFELDKLEALVVIYIFGEHKGQLMLTDWRGEENEMEIESFLEDMLQIKNDWKNVKETRNGVDVEKQGDGKFIINLYKSIDKDLAPLNKRLIFIGLGWDAFVYTVIDRTSFKIITDKFGTHFHGTEKLSK